jgi:glycosyltransferase involved in cell wall biosynthesis
MSHDRPIRVLHVVDGLNRGGIETWLVQVLRHIDRRRFRMDFLVTSPRPGAYAEEVRALGAEVIPCLSTPVERIALPLRPLWPIRYVRNLGRILRERGPYDIVHSHFDPCGLPLWCARRRGVPVRIAHSHTIRPELQYRSRLVRALLGPLARGWVRRNATAGLAVSRQAARAKFGDGWEHDPRWRVLHPGIDPEPFCQPVSRRAVRGELGIPEDALVVVHVGRFQEEKNHPFLLDIAQALAAREPRLRLLLLGGGRLKADIEQQAARAGLSQRVVFAGERSDVPRVLMGAADVFVFPSLHEGLPLAGVEAQAAGLPCLISDAVPEEVVVVPSLVRRMALQQSAPEWAAAVLELAGEPRAVAPSEALDAIARSDFNIRSTVAELERLYLESLSSSR